MQFLDYESDEERAQQDKFTFSKTEQSITKLTCAACKELPTDARATVCCQEHVCFECFLPIKKNFAFGSGKMWRVCQFCGTKVGQEFNKYEKNSELDSSLYLRKVSKLYHQKLESVMVICPDKNCKVRFFGKFNRSIF